MQIKHSSHRGNSIFFRIYQKKYSWKDAIESITTRKELLQAAKSGKAKPDIRSKVTVTQVGGRGASGHLGGAKAVQKMVS